LKASNTRAEDWFGSSVAISGNTIVVGSPYEDGGGTNAGAAYVFVRGDGGVWSQEAYLKATNPAAILARGGLQFGWTVALSGETALIGAIGEAGSSFGVNGDQSDTRDPGAGAAYVFVRNGTVWSPQAYLKSGYETRRSFGSRLALSGDIAVVGYSSNYGTGVDVFVRSGSQWEAWTLPDQLRSEKVLGVGASTDTVLVDYRHTLHVFSRDGTMWTEKSAPTPLNFGSLHQDYTPAIAVAGDSVVVGDFDNDSPATGIGGNPYATGALDSGAAWVFTGVLPPPPPLTITRPGADILLSWPATASGWTLQSAGDVTAPGAWSDWPQAPAVTGSEFLQTVPVQGERRFFRLRR
jgi:hypothetical protein